MQSIWTIVTCASLLGATATGEDLSARDAAPLEVMDPFRAAIEAPPSPKTQIDVEAELQRGASLMRLGALEAAQRAFLAVRHQAPNHVGALESLRELYSRARRPDLQADVLAALVEAYHASHQRDAAQTRLNELLLLAPNHPDRADLEALLGRNVGPRVAADGDTHWLDRLRSLFGIVVLLGIAFLFSNNRRRISWRVVGWGLSLQLIFAVVILWTTPGRWVFDEMRGVVDRILSFTDAGAGFLFGSLYRGIAVGGGGGPVQVIDGTTYDYVNLGLVFAFHVLPTIIFFGALMSVLYHLGLVQKVVHGVAWVMRRTMGTSGSESLSAASNIFVGQTEAPLVVKPYVGAMTQSELMAIMTGGFATVAGGVLAAYARFGIDVGHLLAASVMSAPAALVVAKIIVPETEVSETQAGRLADPEKTTANVVDAAASGAIDGLKLAVNVAAMLVAFIALVAMANWILGLVGLSLREIFGYAFYPISWCMGVATSDLLDFGMLLGTKISINEFVAYVDLGHLKSTLEPRSFTIATYALCGFANFSSIGIQIGGISGIAPSRRSDLARLGLRAMIGGAIASWLTACIAGVLL